MPSSGGGRVVKNVAGYDFPKLLTGSLGTLGVIAEMTLKVRPRPEATAMAIVPLDDAPSLADALDRLNTSATRPVAIEVLNNAAARDIEAGMSTTTRSRLGRSVTRGPSGVAPVRVARP